MKDNNKKFLILFILGILFITFCCLIVITAILKKENNNMIEDKENTVLSDIIEKKKEDKKTIKSVVESYGSVYISDEFDSVYINFSKNLYDENGRDNKEYFNNLAKDLVIFFKDRNFYMIDSEKKIKIYVETSDNDIKLIINDMENFYDIINGKDFVAVENSKIVEASSMFKKNPYLSTLSVNNMYFSYIEKYLTNGRELENGYSIYVDQQIKVKTLPNKAVFNIIFLEDYEDNILSDVSLKDSLREIEEKHGDYSFGGLDKGYLGYRSGEYYYFFYEDEVSIYPYSYSENAKFERFLGEYLNTKDLDEFVKNIKQNIKSYCEYECDLDIKKAYISFPTRGIKIDIKDNDSKGIELYSNYYFTDLTRQWVKEGKIQYNKKDYVNEYEQMRQEM